MRSIYNDLMDVSKYCIYSLDGKVAAISSDNSPEALEKKQSRIFILLSDGKMLHLQLTKPEPDVEFQLIKTYDFSCYKRIKKAFPNKSWNQLVLAKGSFVHQDKVYVGESPERKLPEDEIFNWTKCGSKGNVKV